MEVQKFTKDLFGEIRVVGIKGEPWFVAKDIADILGYSETNRMTSRLDSDEVMSTKLVGMNMNSTIINESGLYSAVIGSNKPEAKQFKKWVTSEVLPSIRKNGVFATDNFIEMSINNPDYAIELLTKLRDERKARLESEKRIAILTHVNKTYTATEVAKELGMKSAIELNKFLHDQKIQFYQNKTWIPYSNYANLGYFEIKQEVLDSGRVIYHRRITQIGREFIINLFGDAK